MVRASACHAEGREFESRQPRFNKMRPNGKENKIGYGDPECTEDCPIRQENLDFCKLAVLCTKKQIEAAIRGDIDLAAGYEEIQNQATLILLCKPASKRI